jgi:hypothetical protein
MISRRSFSSIAASPIMAQTHREMNISALPNFCSHEHWGSIDSIGTIPGGYRADYEQGAKPTRATGLFDILIEPYMRGLLVGSGVERSQLMRGDGWGWFTEIIRTLQSFRFTGIYECTRRGIQMLYGVDINNLDQKELTRLEASINANYRDPSAWYRRAMQKAHFSELIRPVHPEFYRQRDSQQFADAERIFTHTVMRIDPFLEFWTGPAERRQSMVALSGIQPGDAATWRAFLAYWFDAAGVNGSVGIKQLQAYRRSLDFQPVSDNDVRWNDHDSQQNRRFQDWLVHECCKLAAERGWAHQVHVGTHNLPDSSPLPLQALARRYPKMKLVLIHCWPFLAESGTMARQIANVYLDTCWQPVLNPEFFRSAITQWWNYVPEHKVTCGHDATTVEMAVGSSLFTREVLSTTVRGPGKAYLHNNAVGIYGIGTLV